MQPISLNLLMIPLQSVEKGIFSGSPLGLRVGISHMRASLLPAPSLWSQTHLCSVFLSDYSARVLFFKLLKLSSYLHK